MLRYIITNGKGHRTGCSQSKIFDLVYQVAQFVTSEVTYERWMTGQSPTQSFIVVGQDTYQHMSWPVAIADCAHVQQVTASFKDLVTVALERELYKDTH